MRNRKLIYKRDLNHKEGEGILRALPLRERLYISMLLSLILFL